MRILILSEYFPNSSTKKITGGVENRAYHLAKELSKKHDIYVLTSRQPNAKENETIGSIKVFRIGPVFEYSSTKHILKRAVFGKFLAMKIPFFARIHKIDVIDASSFFTYPAGIAAKIFGIKSFLTYHEVWLGRWCSHTGTSAGNLGEIAEYFIILLSKILKIPFIAVSEKTKKELLDAGIKENKVAVVHNGVETKARAPSKKKKQFCFVGRLIAHKGVDTLIEAFSKVPRSAGFKLKIIGDGPAIGKLKQLAKKLNVDTRTEFTGYLENHKDVLKTVGESYALVHPGTVEGFGIVLLEAMSEKTPYICSDIKVFREITKDGKGGMIFKKNDPQDLSRKMKEMIKDKRQHSRLQKEALELASQYSWKSIATSLLVAYEKF